MEKRRKLSDQDVEQLLAGTAPAGSESTDDLARFVRSAHSTWSAGPTTEAAAAQIARAAEAAAVAGPARSAALKGAPKTWRRRTVLGSVFASLTAKVAGAALAATVATTGALAATGTLPGSAQQTAATIAAKVGFTIPDGPNHQGAAGDENGHPGVTGTVTSTATPRVTGTARGDDHGNEAGNQGDDHGHGHGVTTTVTGTVTGTVTLTATAVVNHGNCVSWVAQNASLLGFTGSEHGALVSTIAKDPAAVSGPVAAGGVPDAACQAEITKAVATLHPSSPTPTTTATAGPTTTVTASPTTTPTNGNSGNGNGNSGNGNGNNGNGNGQGNGNGSGNGKSADAPGHNKGTSNGG